MKLSNFFACMHVIQFSNHQATIKDKTSPGNAACTGKLLYKEIYNHSFIWNFNPQGQQTKNCHFLSNQPSLSPPSARGQCNQMMRGALSTDYERLTAKSLPIIALRSCLKLYLVMQRRVAMCALNCWSQNHHFMNMANPDHGNWMWIMIKHIKLPDCDGFALKQSYRGTGCVIRNTCWRSGASLAGSES